MIFRKNSLKEAVQVLTDLLNADKVVKVEEVKQKRSLNQNSLYWLWIACIVQETGNDKDVIHTFLVEKFLPMKKSIVFGKPTFKPTSTTELDTGKFKQYLDNIQIYIASEGIVLPNPDDLHFAEFVNYYEKYL